jgi:hypothetical protein
LIRSFSRVHPIARLRRQGERYFTDGLRDFGSDRRSAILAVCTVEWKALLGDTVVEIHDRIVGQTEREAKRLHDKQIADSKSAVTETLRAFAALGVNLLEARNDSVPLKMAAAKSAEWGRPEQPVTTGAQLSIRWPASHWLMWQRISWLPPLVSRMLRCLNLKAASVAQPLIATATTFGEMRESESTADIFLRAEILKGTANCVHETECDNRLFGSGYFIWAMLSDPLTSPSTMGCHLLPPTGIDPFHFLNILSVLNK